MPSSTPWRGQASGSITRGLSPFRPSVEPNSPYLHPSSPSFDYNIFQNTLDYSRSRLPQGLGLSGTSLNTESLGLVQPDHIYIDQNGGAHVGARVRPTNHSTRDSAKGGRTTQSKHSNRTARINKAKGHTRSGSTIDDLANAAIATSPTFALSSPNYAFGSPSSLNHARPATSYINGYNNDENLYDRPSKRIKSEKLHAAEWSPRDDRPRTSHNYKFQSRTEDAELLLSLSYGHTWTQVSPVPAPASIFQPLPQTTVQVSSDAVEIVMDEATQPDLEVTAKSEDKTQKEITPEEIRDDEAAKENPIIDETDSKSQNIPDTVPMEEEPEGKSSSVRDDSAPEQVQMQPTPAQQLQQGQLDMPTEVEMTASPAPKKTRRLQPEVQAEVCATCQRLQRDGKDEDSTTHWIGCENCKKWHHAACAGFLDKQEARSVDKFFCKDCEPTCGPTTFVRKSTRARTAIDYAGLNQGVVKPSDDSSMHHYIQPIKDGRIKVNPDDFARVRPELLTAEFWENMDGMKRPFVVPACWNPRFGRNNDALKESSDNLTNSILSEDTFLRQNNDNSNETEPGIETSDKNDESIQTNACQEEVVDCNQDYLDMVMPENLTVRRVAELYGPHEPVPVIDVKSQETKGSFTLSDWAQYYELDGEKPIRNVISLEVSNSRLGRLIRRPKVVRDIDLEDHVWDHESRATGKKRPVQFYCLMSVADSYTDFHIDFGGSSVYYHILKGVKTFFFIPPEDRYLRKYEEWCNSDTQNETWLPDLCGGNVTRVDLHEGDTAFIPAGWIHSVWTPEDSLVIGGNFLTRVDYELQLKVFNIEKSTNVPLKFRYPFFQKVMWYSLLKYLEEDPVPDEVLRDFHEDLDYRFLRANPVWHEVGDFANLAEPGDIEFNARVYPKSELKGLPALRDYLYRTARIYADLPVPDINKKQIESVKASILKGYGDPMQLIKMFAVWCAWKIGNETVPEWVHHDAGLLEAKKAEELKRLESFRVPPERVSARKASQARNTPTIEDPETTPIKAIESTTNDDADRKQRSGSKSSNARLACEPCRKRRIKCRHKEGDISPTNTSPAAIRPRTYSNVSAEIPKLTCASPVMNGYEPAPTMNGSSSDFSNTSDLAQAALASLHSQSSDSGQLPPLSLGPASSKKGRSKACEECRKSKRRCVHDEYGRVDPAKAAEPSKPRGSATKRVAGSSGDFSVKKVKLETEFDTSLMDPALLEMTQPMTFGSMTDPSQITDFENMTNGYDYTFMTHGPEIEMGDVYGTNLITVPHVEDDGENDGHLHQALSSEVIDGATPVNDANVDPNLPPAQLVTLQVAQLRQSPEHDISYSPITVDGQAVDSTEGPDMAMDKAEPSSAISKHSSPQPTQMGKDELEDSKVLMDPVLRSTRSEGREVSTVSEHTTEVTPQSRGTSTNTSATTYQTAALKHKMSVELSGRPVSRGSTASSDLDADERMARELQAAENGLRRRTSVRA